MKSFEVQGQWWLPEHPEHRVTGGLTWDPKSGGTLKLLGQLRPPVVTEHPLPGGNVQRFIDHDNKDKSYPVVLGQVEKREYTLLDAFVSFKRDWSATETTEHVHVNALIESAWFDDRALEADRVHIKMRDLAEWIGKTGLAMIHPRSDAGGANDHEVTGTRVEAIEIPYSHAGVTIQHWLGASSHGNQSVTVTQDWVLHIDSGDPIPWKSFAEIASDFQDLLTIATGRTAEFRTIGLQHPELIEQSLSGPIDGMRRTATLHAQWSNRVDHDREGAKADEPIRHPELYFDFEQVTAEGVGRWLNIAAEYRTELGRVMSTRYNPGYLEDRIMNICAALESFDKHRRQDPDAHYIERIRQCIALAGPIFHDLIAEDPEAWAKRTKKLRNDLAHHDEQFRKEGSVGGHVISEQLYWLFVLCMLRIAEAPTAVFDTIADHNQWRWLQEQARKGIVD